MQQRHQISRRAIALIKRFEGLRRVAAQLADGRWTIGYGHTRTARAGARVDEADAEALLLYDLIAVSHAVNEWTYAPLNQNQYDALVSFAFNIGVANFRQSLTLRRLNEGRPVEAALAMELWRRADFEGERIVVDALVRRRAREKTLFLEPVDAWAPAPSPVLPPRLDYDIASVMPSQTPAVVTASLEGERAQAERSPPELEPEPESEPELELALGLEPEPVPSASQAAAAAVAARLQGIAAADADTVRRPEIGDPAPGASPDLVSAEPPDQTASRRPGPAAMLSEPPPVFAAPPPLRRWWPPSLAWVLALGSVGIGLFVAALVFGFHVPAYGHRAFSGDILGWGLGGAGVGCFGIAAYLLLLRLAGGEGHLGA